MIRYRLLLVLCAVAMWAAACSRARTPIRIYLGKPDLTLPGHMVVTSHGLAAYLPCERHNTYVFEDGVEARDEACDGATIAGLLQLATPWGARVSPRAEPGKYVFELSWEDAGVDPLAPYAAEFVRDGWAITDGHSGQIYEWQPGPRELEQILDAIGLATGIERHVRRDHHAPNLEVVDLIAGDGALLVGAPSRIRLTLRNRGKGGAYRVVAHLRSSLEAVGDLQFSFGAIAAGASETRELTVDVRATTEESAMLVLRFEEANGYVPANYSKRFAIQQVADSPRLSLRCDVLGPRPAGEVEIDAGTPVRLRCEVRNAGNRVAAGAHVELDVAGVFTQSLRRDVAPGQLGTFEVQGQIPDDAAVDAPVDVRVTAREDSGTSMAEQLVRVRVRVPTLCPGGRLTRAQYRAKRAELAKARDAGALSAEEFDRYDAALVGCLE